MVCLLAIASLNPFSVARAQAAHITPKSPSGPPPFQAASVNWLSLGFDPANTSFNPYEQQISPSNVSQLTLDWNFHTGGQNQQSPVEAGGVVYTTKGGIAYALNASTGTQLWSVQVGIATEPDFSPTVANGMLYVIGSKGSDQDYVDALQASTGAQVWRSSRISAIDNSPVVVKGMLYINSITYPGFLIALNASTGVQIWRVRGAAGVVGITVANGYVYTHDGQNGNIIALNAKTGKKRWETGGMADVLDWVAAANGALYAGDTTGNVDAWNASNGHALWSASLGSNIFVNAPAVANGVVYVGFLKGGGGGGVAALDARTGTQLWRSDSSANGFSHPSVANGVVYFGFSNSGGGIAAFDAQMGIQLWSYDQAGYATAIIVNGMVFTGSSKNEIDAFHLPA